MLEAYNEIVAAILSLPSGRYRVGAGDEWGDADGYRGTNLSGTSSRLSELVSREDNDMHTVLTVLPMSLCLPIKMILFGHAFFHLIRPL